MDMNWGTVIIAVGMLLDELLGDEDDRLCH